MFLLRKILPALTARVFNLDFFLPFHFHIHCQQKDRRTYFPLMRDGKPVETLYQVDEKNELPPTPEDIMKRVTWNIVIRPT